jgi:hypothetical protein
LSVAVLVPWRGGDPARERACDWVLARYRDQFPSWDLQLCEAPDGTWSKAASVNPVLAETDAEVVVVADADVWTDGLERAVFAVVCGSAWSMPHREVRRLTPEATRAVLAGNAWQGQPTERLHDGVWGGGIVVGRRDVLLDAPLDTRFTSWGQEDVSWALALNCLHGDGWRGDASLLHLWHPPAPRLDRQRGSEEGWELRKRYGRAKNNPAAMRALIQQAAEEASWALTG